jgi:hypothetical protein
MHKTKGFTMLNLTSYLQSVELPARGVRNSKIEASILSLAQEAVQSGSPLTVKGIVEAGICKTTQQVHQTLSRAKTIKKVKKDKSTLIVPADLC